VDRGGGFKNKGERIIYKHYNSKKHKPPFYFGGDGKKTQMMCHARIHDVDTCLGKDSTFKIADMIATLHRWQRATE
jgi:hypothetical protein